MPFNPDVRDPPESCSGEAGELGCRQGQPHLHVEARSRGRDGFPALHQVMLPFQVIGVKCPQHGQDGWKVGAHRGCWQEKPD